MQSVDEYIVPDATNTTTSIQLGNKKSSPTTLTRQQQQQQQQLQQSSSGSMKVSASSTSVDKPPSSSGFLGSMRSKSSTSTGMGSQAATTATATKSKTIDFPDLLQNTMDGSGSGNVSGSVSGGVGSKMLLTPSGRPIQSILRRSETPPTTKANLRQTSLDSAESSVSALGGHGAAAAVRETSIEKLLKSTSTSRPLIFNS